MRSIFKLKCLSILFLFIVMLIPIKINASSKERLVNIYFFHSSTCSHCNSEIKLLDSLEKKYKNIKIYRYEVHEEDNKRKYESVCVHFDIKSGGVPVTVIGDTVYIGYSENVSTLKFIKTIEYYSRYGYKDEVGRILGIESVSNYYDEDAVSLDEFMEEYGNYKLAFGLSTNKIDTSMSASILGILSFVNVVSLVSILLVCFIYFKTGNVWYLLFFLLVRLVLNIYGVCLDESYIVIMLIGLISYLCMCLISRFNFKKLYGLLVLLIIYISTFLEMKIYNYSYIFKEIIRLNNIEGINKVSYYSNYIFVSLIVSILIIIIIYKMKREDY